MKKYFMLLFVYSNILLFAQNSPFDGNGDGSIGNPYQLWTKAHLEELADSINNSWVPNFSTWHFDKHFKLMDDINDALTKSIGKYGFHGHFHGNGKTITVAINYDFGTNQSFAIFNGLMNNASVDSLIVCGYVNSDIAAMSTISAYINGNNFASISNCINNATITGWSAGGITYSNYGTISNCINNSDITGVDNVGGIAGENSGTIINCINNGTITATASGSQPNGAGGVGGIVAYGSVSNCINLGSVVGQNNVGGIVGLGVQSIVSNCINYGFINGIGKVGGICGSSSHIIFSGVSISNSVNVGVVEGEEDIGSIVGKE